MAGVEGTCRRPGAAHVRHGAARRRRPLPDLPRPAAHPPPGPLAARDDGGAPGNPRPRRASHLEAGGDRTLSALRRNYEPYIQALSAYFHVGGPPLAGCTGLGLTTGRHARWKQRPKTPSISEQGNANRFRCSLSASAEPSMHWAAARRAPTRNVRALLGPCISYSNIFSPPVRGVASLGPGSPAFFDAMRELHRERPGVLAEPTGGTGSRRRSSSQPRNRFAGTVPPVDRAGGSFRA